MRRGLAVVFLLAAACASSHKTDELPAMVPPAQPLYAAPSVESQVAAVQTSMTELLERLDVLNARIAKLESGGQPPAAVLVAEHVSPTTTKQIVETYESKDATIVEVPAAKAGDARVVMIYDETLPADL